MRIKYTHFGNDIGYLLKIQELINQGYNVIENVPFEVLEEPETQTVERLVNEHN